MTVPYVQKDSGGNRKGAVIFMVNQRVAAKKENRKTAPVGFPLERPQDTAAAIQTAKMIQFGTKGILGKLK